MECFSPATPCSSPFFLLRQDSAQRKVFILINNQENILYNFNKVVGDTLKALDLSTGPSAIYTYTVIAIDSVLLLDNKYHKRFRYSTYNWNYAIEGVGGEWGLLTPYFTVFETGRETICLGTNRTSTIIYMNPAIQQPDAHRTLWEIKSLKIKTRSLFIQIRCRINCTLKIFKITISLCEIFWEKKLY